MKIVVPLLAAGALLAANPAAAATKLFSYSSGGTDVATGSFSYADGSTGVLGYGDLSAFSVTVAGATYTLADVLPLTDYVHFAYDITGNSFVVDQNSCGFAGCGFQSSLSAINSAGNFGFFFTGAPGAYREYSNGVGGSFDTITISGVPEPMTWAMMVLGLGAVGVAMRTRRKVTVSYS